MGPSLVRVVALSQRVAAAYADKKRAGADDRAGWKSIKQRVEGAVERGEMTPEEADAMYRGITERMAARDAVGAESRPDGDHWSAGGYDPKQNPNIKRGPQIVSKASLTSNRS